MEPKKYKHVYKRKGGLLYFERRGQRSCRLFSAEGTAEFDAEYLAALNAAPTATAAAIKTASGGCHFTEMERQAKLRARKYGREFSLPLGWMLDQFERQNGKCALSGMLLLKDRAKHAPNAPSIDRKDSTKGYSPDNCRLVAYIVNCAKNQFTERELLDMCRAIVVRRGLGRFGDTA